MTWVCLDCSTAYSVGAPLCPHCGSERRADEGSAAALGIQASRSTDSEEDSMPKITRHGGASVADEATEPEGGEDVSAGADTSASSETPSTKPEQSEKPRRKPARTTGSRSRPDQTAAESSTAGSTDTSGPETDAADDK